jgi:hypothetical protein
MAREVCDHLWPTDSEPPCPECTKEYARTRRYLVWGVVSPSGEINVDSHFKSESDAWRIALGWPDEEDIERAKKEGWIAKKVLVIV